MNRQLAVTAVTMLRIAAMLVLSVALRPSPSGAQGSTVTDQAYTCPMHLDVRGKAGEKCPRCGMTLIPLTVRDYEPYRLEVLSPRAPQPRAQTHVRFVVRAPQSEAISTRFELVHERILHLFVVSHDLSFFQHVHPTLSRDGVFEQALVLPRPGAYRLIADFVPVGAMPQVVQKTIVTAGFQGPITPTALQAPDMSDKVVGGVRVKLVMEPAQSAHEQILVFQLEDASTGQPVRDLEPYLAAPGHLLIVSGDLSAAEHSHPLVDLSTGLGPQIAFQVLFPRPGVYRLWLQFQRGGRVLTASFTARTQTLDSAGR